MADPSLEFELIARLWRPLSNEHAGSFGLRDDVAQLPVSSKGFVVTADQVIEGTHFLPSDPLEWVGRRLVRRNASDLIAKGAHPVAAFLALAWPTGRSRHELTDFASGLGQTLASECANCPLMGGDTSTTHGPLVASLTLIGQPLAATGLPILRSGARVGDRLMLAGYVGEAHLGLQVRLGRLASDGLAGAVAFAQAPAPPPLAFAALVAHYAKASLDVSDGLLADARHLAQASQVRATLELNSLPVSQEAQMWLAAQPDRIAAQLALATGGEDYQPLMAIDPADARPLTSAAKQLGVTITDIGSIEAGTGLGVTAGNQEIDLPNRLGWQIRAD